MDFDLHLLLPPPLPPRLRQNAISSDVYNIRQLLNYNSAVKYSIRPFMHHSAVYAPFVRLCTIRPFMHHPSVYAPSSVNALFVYLCIICPFMHQSTVYAPFGRLCTIRLFMHHLAVCASFGCLCTIRPFTKKWIASLAMYTWF